MSKRHSRGFTLVEVMVAIAILGLVGATITLANSQVANNARMITEQQTGRWLTQNTLAQMRLLAVLPEPGVTTNPVEYGGLTWRVEVTTTVPELGIDMLSSYVRRVEIKAYLGDDTNAVDTLNALLAEADV